MVLFSFHEFHYITIRIFDHRNANTGTDFFLRYSKFYTEFLEITAKLREILYYKGHITKPCLIF